MSRVRKEIDIDRLKSSIDELESSAAFRTQSELWLAVSKQPWALEQGISSSVIYQRVKEHGITCKTPPARRVDGSRQEIDLIGLQETIDFVESNETFKTQGALWDAVAANEWAQANGHTAAQIYQAVRQSEGKVATKTQPARKFGPRKAASIESDVPNDDSD